MACSKGLIKFEKWGDLVSLLTMAPGSGLLQSVERHVVKVVIGPTLFGLCNCAPKQLETISARLTPGGGCDSSEGGLTVNIPPLESP